MFDYFTFEDICNYDKTKYSSCATESLRIKLNATPEAFGHTVINVGYTDYGGTFFDKVLIQYFMEKHPESILVEDVIYNGQNALIFGKLADAFKAETTNYILGFEELEEYYSEKERAVMERDVIEFVEHLNGTYEFDRDAVLTYIFESLNSGYTIETTGLDYSESEWIDELKKNNLIKEKNK